MNTKLIELGKQDYIPNLQRGDAVACTTLRNQILGVVRGYSKTGAIQLACPWTRYDKTQFTREITINRTDTKKLVKVDIQSLPQEDQLKLSELIKQYK